MVPMKLNVEIVNQPSKQRLNAKSVAKGRWQLACVLVVVALLWGFVFPAISETEYQITKQRQLEERGINPMAMFYTDHPSVQNRLLKSKTENAEPTLR